MRDCAPIMPPPAFRPGRDAGSHDFGIVSLGADVVCVHAPATRAAGVDQIVRSCAVRSQCHAEGRSLTTTAWSPNTKPRRWKRRGFGIPGGDGRGQLKAQRLSTAAPNGLQPENAIFRPGAFCPSEASRPNRNEALKQHHPDVPEGRATMHAPATSRPVRWMGMPAAMRAVAPEAGMTRFARTAPGKARTCGETRPGDRAPGDRNAGERRDAFAAPEFHQQPRGRCLTRTA